MVSLVLVAAVAALIAVMTAWRLADKHADRAVWRRLAATQPHAPAAFNVSMLDDLPGPAQRFFRFAIEPGAALRTVAEISMQGEFSLGSKAAPNYQPMQAEQILATPHGFVWSVRVGRLITGSDAAEDSNSWSRFWVLGIAPVARAGDNPDHARAAFGRHVAEAVFWTPAALLPGEYVRWQAVDDSKARAIVAYKGMEQAVDVTVGEDGQPTQIVFQRWSNANPDKIFQLQPFGGYLSEFQLFEGFRLPTRVQAGNFFGTDDYFEFFKVNVTSLNFPRVDSD